MAEMRLIDANALDFCFPMLDDFNSMIKQMGIEMAKARVMNAPTVDAVEVVRCRDCKHCFFRRHNEKYYCRRVNGLAECVNEDDFCSRGERKTDISTTQADEDKTDSGLVTED